MTAKQMGRKRWENVSAEERSRLMSEASKKGVLAKKVAAENRKRKKNNHSPLLASS